MIHTETYIVCDNCCVKGPRLDLSDKSLGAWSESEIKLKERAKKLGWSIRWWGEKRKYWCPSCKHLMGDL